MKDKIVYLVFCRRLNKWAKKRGDSYKNKIVWVDDHRKASKWNGTGPLRQSFDSGLLRDSNEKLEVHAFREELSFVGFSTADDFNKERG